MIRSRMASAIVGSPTMSYQLGDGYCEVMIVDFLSCLSSIISSRIGRSLAGAGKRMCQNEPNPESRIKDFRGFFVFPRVGKCSQWHFLFFPILGKLFFADFLFSQCWECRFSAFFDFSPRGKASFSRFSFIVPLRKLLFAVFYQLYPVPE